MWFRQHGDMIAGDLPDLVVREIQVLQLGKGRYLRRPGAQLTVADVQALQSIQEADADLPLAQLREQLQVTDLHWNHLQRVV